MGKARDLARVSPDSSGRILLPSGVAGVLPDANAPSGSVIQIQSVIMTDQLVFNSGSAGQAAHYSIPGMSVAITPLNANSRFLLIAQITTGQTPGSYNSYFSFYRGETKVGAGSQQNSAADTSGASFRAFEMDAYNTLGMTFLDSPNTTSSITYSLRIRNAGGSVSPSYVNRSSTTQPWHSGCSSTLTVLEIAQ